MHLSRSSSRIVMVTLGIRIMANLPDRKDGHRRVEHGGQSGHFYLAESGHFYLGITTCLRVTGLMLRPSLGAAWLAWQIGPPVGFGAEPSAVAGPPSQRAAPPATLLAPPSLSFRLEKETTVAAVNPRHPPRSASPESWPGMPELVAGMDIMESLYLT